jgi:hypothetical protein
MSLQHRIDALENLVETRDEEIRRRDTIIMNMTEAMKALSPPSQEGTSDERESSETVEKATDRAEPHSATVEAQGGTQRPWWRRILGGRG